MIEVGAAVERVKVGDRVCLPFNISCGCCENCERGFTAACLLANPGSVGAAYGYAAADDSALLPQARLEYQLGRQRAMSASWVNEAAREQRLQRIEKTYAEQVETLRAAAR